MTKLPEGTNVTLALIKAVQVDVAPTWCETLGDRPRRYSRASVVTFQLKLFEDSPRALIGQFDCQDSAPLIAALNACNAQRALRPRCRGPGPFGDFREVNLVD